MRRGNAKTSAHLAALFAALLAICVAAPAVSAELEGEQLLESPQAVAEREDSEFAYADLTPQQEEELLREHFAPQLEAIDADPARALADVALQRIDSPTGALVTWDGEPGLLESEVPLGPRKRTATSTRWNWHWRRPRTATNRQTHWSTSASPTAPPSRSRSARRGLR